MATIGLRRGKSSKIKGQLVHTQQGKSNSQLDNTPPAASVPTPDNRARKRTLSEKFYYRAMPKPQAQIAANQVSDTSAFQPISQTQDNEFMRLMGNQQARLTKYQGNDVSAQARANHTILELRQQLAAMEKEHERLQIRNEHHTATLQQLQMDQGETLARTIQQNKQERAQLVEVVQRMDHKLNTTLES